MQVSREPTLTCLLELPELLLGQLHTLFGLSFWLQTVRQAAKEHSKQHGERECAVKPGMVQSQHFRARAAQEECGLREEPKPRLLASAAAKSCFWAGTVWEPQAGSEGSTTQHVLGTAKWRAPKHPSTQGLYA